MAGFHSVDTGSNPDRNGNYFYCDDDKKFTLNPYNEEEDCMDIEKALSIAGLVYLTEEE